MTLPFYNFNVGLHQSFKQKARTVTAVIGPLFAQAGRQASKVSFIKCGKVDPVLSGHPQRMAGLPLNTGDRLIQIPHNKNATLSHN